MCMLPFMTVFETVDVGVEWKWKLDFFFFGGNICVFMLCVVLWFVLRLVLHC